LHACRSTLEDPLEEIQLGGGGKTLLEDLSQKTKSWFVGYYPFWRIKQKFELENQGLNFPHEVLGTPTTNDEKLFIITDLLYTIFDVQKLKEKLCNLKPFSLISGKINFKDFPQNKLVYIFGDFGIKEFSKLISSVEKSFNIFGLFIFQLAKLKNAKEHFLILIPSKNLNYFNLCIIFFITSFGKIRFPILNFKTFISSLIGLSYRKFLNKKFQKQKEKQSEKEIPSTMLGTELEFVIMVIAVSCVKLLSAHNSTQHTSRKHKV
jgi:hypothetical protein